MNPVTHDQPTTVKVLLRATFTDKVLVVSAWWATKAAPGVLGYLVINDKLPTEVPAGVLALGILVVSSSTLLLLFGSLTALLASSTAGLKTSAGFATFFAAFNTASMVWMSLQATATTAAVLVAVVGSVSIGWAWWTGHRLTRSTRIVIGVPGEETQTGVIPVQGR